MINNSFPRLLLAQLQLSPEQEQGLLASCDLSVAALDDDAAIDSDRFHRLFQLALERGKPTLGLAMGQQASLLALGPLGITVLAAPNLGLALTTLAEFLAITVDYLSLAVIQQPDQIRVQLKLHKSLGVSQVAQQEVSLLLLQQVVQAIVGNLPKGSRYQMSWDKPSYWRNYDEAYAAPMAFNANETELLLPSQYWLHPSPFRSATQWQRGLATCRLNQHELQRLVVSPMSAKVLSLLRHSESLPPLPQLCQQLCLSSRSLNRHLAAEGTGFRELVQRVRMERAHQALMDPRLSVEAVSAKLGYSDVANFRRACQRWFNLPPSALRAC